MFGQIKNNLAAKVTISLRYHMDTEIVGHDDEAGKDIRASKLYIDAQPIDQNVEDIVLEQEKTRKSVKTQRAKAEVWLVTFLAGKGEVPSRFVVRAGKEAGYSRDAIHRARRETRGPHRGDQSPGRPKTDSLEALTRMMQQLQ